MLHRPKYVSSVAKDYFSGSTFDAQTGYYVFSSRIIADMAPGFIAFKQRADAEKFQKESGGQIMSYSEALSIWAERKANR
jgi:nitrous oxide reductase accessory protein NosL